MPERSRQLLNLKSLIRPVVSGRLVTDGRKESQPCPIDLTAS